VSAERQTEVVIVEDHLALRKGMELLLVREGMRVTGVTATADTAQQMILARRPDVAIIDIGLERGSGIEVALEVLTEWPDARILLYTGGRLDEPALREALAAGVRGIAMKAGPPEELVTAVQAIADGRHYIDPRFDAYLRDQAEATPLSEREREILRLMAAGLKTGEIADDLVISPATVETHVRNLKRKLGARTRVHALALALELVNRAG
jgi:DNA-binding NarL/FixJ family response regulator